MKSDSTSGKSDSPEGHGKANGQKEDVRALWKMAARKSLEAQKSPESKKLMQDINSGHDLSQWEPDLCIQMLRIPAAQNYVAISKLLKQASMKWMLEFLECDGLGVLLESLEKLGARGFSSVADTFSQLQCVSCLRAVMNSQVGLEYIVQHRQYTRQLANILMSRNNSVKLQVFELLCALCIYSSKGHSLALDSLNYFKISHGRRYRFDLVIHELRAADTVAYQTTLLAFINCAILGAQDIIQRNRIRTELFGVGLDCVVSELRFVEDDALQIQLKVFDDNQAKDEEQEEPLSVPHLFDVLYKKVANTPQVLALQSILLGLSQINPSDPESDRIWESVQETVSEAQNSRKPKKRISSLRTREFGTQTTGNRWVTTKRRASCTVGVQVDAVNITPALSLPLINDQPVDVPDLNQSSASLPGSNTDLKLSPNSSVEICKNCLRKFLREEHQNPVSSTREENNPSNIPNSEMNSSPSVDQNQRASFTKIRKSPPPGRGSNHNSTSIIVDEPFIKNIIPTQVSPTSNVCISTNNYSTSESLSDDRLPTISTSAPIPPPLPGTGTDITSFPLNCSSNQTIPLPPPMPCGFTPSPPPPPPPMPCDFTPPPPPPPPMPSSSPPAPPPPPPPMPCGSTPPPPPMPCGSAPPPPPPPMPFGSQSPPPPPMLFNSAPPPHLSFSHSTPLCYPPPPPMINLGSSINGSSTPVCEPFITRERMESIFSTTPNRSASYHTLPNRRLHSSDLESCYNKYNTLPKPSKKMKTLNWTKVPNQIIGNSIWASAARPQVPIDRGTYSQIEELFCEKPRPKSLPAQASLDLPTPTLTSLLDNKRSLAVNIFLKQFRSGAPGVLEALRNCEGLPVEKLKGFLRILPEDHEVSAIKAHAGEPNTLETAERFYFDLLKIPDYTLRVEAMLQKEECPVIVEELTPQLETIISTCDNLIQNRKLPEFLALLLQLGNYLNAGSYAGNAAGFKLNTLPKLLDTRANKPRMTFLHFAVEVAQRHSSDSLTFTDELITLKTLARNPLSSLEEEVKTLAAAVKKLDKQVKVAKSTDILPKFKEFLKKAEKDVEKLSLLVVECRTGEKRLAEHFCEDTKTFQLEECFLQLADFCAKIKAILVDNEQRKKQEERAARIEAEKITNSEPAAVRKIKGKQKIFQTEESDLVDILMKEIKVGNFKLRRSLPASGT